MGDNRATSFAKPVHSLFLVATFSFCGHAVAESWTVAPEISLSETYSTNMALTTGDRSQGWITDITPGLHINGTGSHITANLDYRLDSLHYATRPDLSHNLNVLSSNATVEAIDKWLYFDASANIMQRRQSAFDAVATDSTNATTNQSETKTLQFSPRVQGHISDIADYQMRLNTIDSRSNDVYFSNTKVTQLSGSVKNASSGAQIGWSMNGDGTKIQNDIIGNRYNGRVSGSLIFALFPQAHLSLSDGMENTNYEGNGMQTTTTPGLGLEWSPSQRTQVAAQGQRRFFGTSHNLLLSHRAAWTNWRYTDIKDAANLPASLAGSSQGTVVGLMSDLLAASIPDPVARAAAVRARFEQNGLNMSQLSVGAVQSSRLSINSSREASVTLAGTRNTATLSITRLDQQAIDNAAGTIDNFALSNRIRQQGGSIAWAHRLTPLTSLSITTARLKTIGLDAVNLNSNQSSHSAFLTYRMGPQTIAALGGRIVKFDSTIGGIFHEYAAVCSITQRF